MAQSKKLSVKRTPGRSKAKAKSNGNRIGARALLSDILPLPERKFQGRIGTYYTDSEAEVPSMPSAPEGAPNVLLNRGFVPRHWSKTVRAAKCLVVVNLSCYEIVQVIGVNIFPAFCEDLSSRY